MTDMPEWTGLTAPNADALPQLSTLEAFDAARLFLESYWEEGGKAEDEIRRLLSAMLRDLSFASDGGPIDPAMWQHWLVAVGRVKKVDLSAEVERQYGPKR
jgi:hypothetical protein